MKKIGILFFVLYTLLVGCKTNNHQDSVIAFSYFRGEKDGLKMAYSKDGLKFTDLTPDKNSLFKPSPETSKVFRDPFITLGDDGVFHMCWTTSWKGKTIGIAHSKDLINWYGETVVEVMADFPETVNCWAPEMFWDDKNNVWLIYWASTVENMFTETIEENTIDGELKNNNRMFYCTTSDFSSFSQTKIFYDPKFNVIDVTIQRENDEYIMVIKDVTWKPIQKNLMVVKSKSLYGPWSKPVSPFSGKEFAEGATFIKIDDYWNIYWDKYKDKKFGAVQTKNFKDFNFISDQLVIPEGARHGTVFYIKPTILENLINNSANNH